MVLIEVSVEILVCRSYDPVVLELAVGRDVHPSGGQAWIVIKVGPVRVSFGSARNLLALFTLSRAWSTAFFEDVAPGTGGDPKMGSGIKVGSHFTF